MKFLIAGLGSVGRRHLRNLLALGERDIVLLRTGQSTLPEVELSGFPVERDLDSALARCPDAVIVSNPTSLHLQVAVPAARAGCHILMEKPVSDSLAGISELREAVREGGGQVLVGYQFRFHPGLVEAGRILNEGIIGRPLSARAVYAEYLPGMHPWEDYRASYSARHDLGGGVILTLCHPLDYLRWLLGEVEAVWAFAGKLSDLEIDVEDTAEIGLRFAGHALGSVHLDYNRQPAAHQMEIIGTQGTLNWDYTQDDLQIQEAGKAACKIVPGSGRFERNDMFLAEMRHFREVMTGAKPICTLEDGIRSLQIALAARQSAVDGRLGDIPSGL